MKLNHYFCLFYNFDHLKFPWKSMVGFIFHASHHRQLCLVFSGIWYLSSIELNKCIALWEQPFFFHRHQPNILTVGKTGCFYLIKKLSKVLISFNEQLQNKLAYNWVIFWIVSSYARIQNLMFILYNLLHQILVIAELKGSLGSLKAIVIKQQKWSINLRSRQ